MTRRGTNAALTWLILGLVSLDHTRLVTAFSMTPCRRPASSVPTLLEAHAASDDSGSVSGKRPSSSLPPRNKKKDRSKSKKKTPDPSTIALSEDDLSEFHVSQYLRGSSNLFRKMKMEGMPHSPESLIATPHPVGGSQSLEGRPVLVLNADYQPMSYLPLSLWHWQEAVKAVFAGKVTVVDVYPNITIRSANVHVRLPSVIALREYVPTQRYLHQHAPAFTKRNVFLRDEYRCQYCNVQFNSKDLSLDHVQPRCLGGRLNWENSVTCCKVCNGRKGSLTLKEISRVGMKLSRPPFVPSQFELSRIAASMLLPRKVHATWHPYLGIVHEAAKESQSAARRHNHDGESNNKPSNMAQVLLSEEG